MRSVIIFIFFLIPFIAGNSFSATFTDEVGRKVEIKATPRRIVSVAPSVTEILFALGLEERIVGVSTFCQFPPAALPKEKIGGYINPSLERIVAREPDLVIGIAEGDLKNFIDRLAGLGIPVYITNPRNVSEVIASIENIGAVTSASPAAEKIADAMRARIRAVQQRVQGRPHPRVLHVLSFDPLLTAGKGTFVDDLIRLGGGRNIAANAPGRYPRFSLEEIINQDPQVIILSSMKSQDPMAEERRWWKRWKMISAVQHGRIYVIDSDLIHRPSPRMVDGLEEMATAIHPEAFKERVRELEGSRGQAK